MKQKSGIQKILEAIFMTIGILYIISVLGSCMGCLNSNRSSNSSGEQRCWSCGKVIFNNDSAIHATYKMGNTYTCDYCGTSNVKK